MKTKWNKWAKNIPSRTKIAPKVWYEVLSINEFPNKDLYGEARYPEKQLILKNGLGPKLKTETYLHEVFHALSEEHNIGLTEEQVINFERTFPYLIDIIKQLEGIDE
jgi:hypothetical protein